MSQLTGFSLENNHSNIMEVYLESPLEWVIVQNIYRGLDIMYVWV